MSAPNLKPHSEWRNVHIEQTQLSLARGTWVQVCIPVGSIAEPRFEVIEVIHDHDGAVRLNSNIPSKPWPSATGEGVGE